MPSCHCFRRPVMKPQEKKPRSVKSYTWRRQTRPHRPGMSLALSTNILASGFKAGVAAGSSRRTRARGPSRIRASDEVRRVIRIPSANCAEPPLGRHRLTSL